MRAENGDDDEGDEVFASLGRLWWFAAEDGGEGRQVESHRAAVRFVGATATLALHGEGRSSALIVCGRMSLILDIYSDMNEDGVGGGGDKTSRAIPEK